MNPISRAFILQGPCQLQYNGVTLYSKEDVTVTLNGKYTEIVSDAIGRIDYRDDDFIAEITFQPDGQLTAALLALLFPISQNAALFPGMSVFPNADLPLKIYTRDGFLHEFFNAALTKDPGFAATPAKTVYTGNVTFTALRATGQAWSAANSLFQSSAQAYPGDDAYDDANIITSVFALRWVTGATPTGDVAVSEASPAVFTADAHGLVVGDRVLIAGCANAALNGTFVVAAADFTVNAFTLQTFGGAALDNTVGVDAGTFTRVNWVDGFTTEAGFELATNISTHQVATDDQGVVDVRFEKIEVTATSIPIGPTPGQIVAALGAQGAGATRGRSRSSLGANLYLSGSGVYAKVPNAFLTEVTPVIASMSKKRLGKTTWKALVSNTAGAQGAALALSTEVID